MQETTYAISIAFRLKKQKQNKNTLFSVNQIRKTEFRVGHLGQTNWPCPWLMEVSMT